MDKQTKYPYNLGRTIECILGIVLITPAFSILVESIDGYMFDYDEEQIEGIFYAIVSVGGATLIKNNVNHLFNFIKNKYYKYKIWKKHRKARNNISQRKSQLF